MDEALSRVVVDLSGRPGLYTDVTYTRARIGDFDVDLLQEFFQALVTTRITLHIDNLKGKNAHHQAESIFKALGCFALPLATISPIRNAVNQSALK